ncbi:aminotransferase class V-fold PLP-dependent enzyme [Roseibium polysiphoniae]|uniref:aminotransferase class V-fold PLP-dependent enzyme n=1 Tax=Roseibium polysiphoniae TaxID=2571221 RepID=UPI00329966EA
MTKAHSLFEDFANRLQGPDLASRLRAGLIGEGAMIEGPFGAKPLIYADYVASGRALRQIEDFILTEVLPYYANSHTEASWCGSQMTRLRAAARSEIARLCGAQEGFATIFAGSGATAGLNRLVHLLGVSDAEHAGGRKPLVLIGPYEHHSNILPWRESGAEVIEIGEAAQGGPDLEELETVLRDKSAERLTIGSFSLMSNVTGIVTDADQVTRILKRHGALSVWDCAGSGPYLPIDMKAGTDAQKDAIVVSPHKFIGGPGASGVLIVREGAVRRHLPVQPGGGTVRFVSPWGHDYSESLAAREEAGTPNVVGDIRAALCFLVKDALGQTFLDQRHDELRQAAINRWRANENIEILGNPEATYKVPMFSFRVRDRLNGGYLHQQLVTRMLSDLYGIQARGGCACAGPYAHRLLGYDRDTSNAMRASILAGEELEKPGWTRLNFSALMSPEKVETVLRAVDDLARNPYPMCEAYHCDETTARFKAREEAA